MLTGIFFGFSNLSFSQVNKDAPLSDIEQVKAELFEKVAENRKSQEYKPDWQKDFESLQFKLNDEIARNMRLNIEQKILQNEETKLKKELQDKQKKSLDLESKVHDQVELQDQKKWKARIADEQKQFEKQLADKNRELKENQRDLKLVEDKVTVAQLKLKLMGVEDYSDKLLAVQQQRDLLEAQLISQEEKEKNLIEKIKEIKGSRKKMDPSLAALKTEIDGLREELKQIEKKQNALTGKSGPSAQEQIEILSKQRASLVRENIEIKAKIDRYKSSQKMGIENKRVKDLVEAISAVDAANNDLNEEIKNLNENIIILKMRVKKLEYKDESMRAIRGKNNATDSTRN